MYAVITRNTIKWLYKYNELEILILISKTIMTFFSVYRINDANYLQLNRK